MTARGACLLALLLPLAACAGPQYSKAQLDALEIRDTDAPPDRAFAAASNAVLDASYQVLLTDADAGLLTAMRRVDPSVAEHAAVITLSTLLTLGRGPVDAEPNYYALGIQVPPRPGGQSSVRIRTFGPRGATPNRDTIQQIWTLMERQVLMKEPSRPEALPPP